ncbi:energy transducer TonB [uncultured Bacteroides sp.]|nr:energy transducer TonB [uncultured Bacteroides sp.]
MKSRIGMFQLIGGLVSLADKMADEEYKQGKMSTGKYVGNKLLNKTLSGGSVDKLEKEMDQLSEDWEKKFSESMHDIPDDSFKGYSRLSLLKLPSGVSSISVESFNSRFIPKVYTSDNKQIIELEKELQLRRSEEERRRTEEEKDCVFDVVENMPDFPGGQAALMQYLHANIKYPSIAQEEGIQGRVIVQFVVKADGSIANAVVARSVSPEIDKEALRLVNSMPKWEPGMQRGKAVNVNITVPIMFRLQ